MALWLCHEPWCGSQRRVGSGRPRVDRKEGGGSYHDVIVIVIVIVILMARVQGEPGWLVVSLRLHNENDIVMTCHDITQCEK